MQLTRLVQAAGPALGDGQPSGPRVWMALTLVAVSTIAGAWLARHKSKHLMAWLAIASATMLVVTLTDLVPDAWRDAVQTGVPLWSIGVAAAIGFLAITYLTREEHGLEVASDERPAGVHAPGRHRQLKDAVGAAVFGGMGTAAALTTHRAIEGATLALSTSAVVVIALMVHSASEGLALAALLDMAEQRMVPWLVVACLSPVAGVLLAIVTPLPGRVVPVLLGMVAGVLLRTALVGLRHAVRRREDERPASRHLAIAAVVAVTVGALLAMAHELQLRVGRDQNTRFIETFGHGAPQPPRWAVRPDVTDRTPRSKPSPERRRKSPEQRSWAAGPPAHGASAARPPAQGPSAATSPVRRSSAATSPERRSTSAGSPSAESATAKAPGQRSPAARSPVPGRSAAVRSAAGRSAAGTSAAGTSAAGTSAAGTSAAGTPAAGTPAARSPERRTAAQRARAEMLAAVKSGRTGLAEVFERKDATAKRLRVAQLLDALPGCDRAKVSTLMANGRVDRDRRVGALSEGQRRRLLSAFARCRR